MNEIEIIVKQLTEARKAYYDSGEPIMSDAEFDDLEDKLKELDPENAYFNGIGEDESDGFAKAKHVILMGSQGKCNTTEDIIKKLQHFSGKKVAFVVEPKCDGCLDADTILDTDKGPLSIGNIVENRISCNVKSLDMDTMQEVFTPVKNFFINQNDYDWYNLTLDNGTILKVTGNHKVWLPELLCWRRVEDLNEGDVFLTEKV